MAKGDPSHDCILEGPGRTPGVWALSWGLPRVCCGWGCDDCPGGVGYAVLGRALYVLGEHSGEEKGNPVQGLPRWARDSPLSRSGRVKGSFFVPLS